MSRSRLEWVPPFVAGLVAVIAAEVASGLLLYSGVGLFRSFTLLLAVVLGSLAVGVWSTPGDPDGSMVEGARKRWMLALVAYSLAAATAGVWGYRGGLNSDLLTRGLGLALLAGFPAYSVGALLASLGLLSHDGRKVAVSALAGATAGAVLMATVLISSLIPVSMFGLCLVALSGSALIHGRILDHRVERLVIDEAASLLGRVKVEDHLLGARRTSQRRLSVEGRLIGGTEDGLALRAWEASLSEALGQAQRGLRLLFLGGSPAALIQSCIKAGHELVVVEPNPAVRQMLVRHFGVPLQDQALTWCGAEELHALPSALGGFDAAILDGASWWSHTHPLPSLSVLETLRGVVSETGVLYVGAEDPSALLAGSEALVAKRVGATGWESWSVFRGVDRALLGGGLLALGPSTALPSYLTWMKRVMYSTVAPEDGSSSPESQDGSEVWPIEELAPDVAEDTP